ncbi:MAG: 16S rRNA (adenine(1518)-N(6)/adenine(1519)-N(6))-dimethyltransferase RsmA [Gammaproteobacteria bacterium]
MNKPKKNFGQNFLIDQVVLSRILRSLLPEDNDNFLEIGCGKGALTKKILSSGASLVGVEIDRDLISDLEDLATNHKNFKVINEDILKITLKDINDEKKLRVVGNLPYNISSKIVVWAVENRHYIQDAHFMLQKEFAERLLSPPDNKSYGRLSIFTQLFFSIEKLLAVPSASFKPEPKVESIFLKLRPKENYNLQDIDIKSLERITQKAFSKRRKKISTSLKGIISPEEMIQLNLDPNQRAENLSVEDYVLITKHINN